MKSWLHRLVFGRRWRTFVVMGLAFLVFGAGTYNLFHLVLANAELLLTHGWTVLADGAALQVVELLLTAYLSMAAYVLFKACEHRLVRWLAEPDGVTE